MTDRLTSFVTAFCMEMPPPPRVTSTDKLQGGIVVSFDDGTCAIYSAELLQTMKSLAKLGKFGQTDGTTKFGAQ
jgi:hypothetical protein